MAGKEQPRLKSAAERFLDVILDPLSSEMERWNARMDLECSKLRRETRQALVASRIDDLVNFAQANSTLANDNTYGTRLDVVRTIELAPREVAIEGLKKVKATEPDRDLHNQIRAAIVDRQRSLQNTRRMLRRKTEGAVAPAAP